MSVKNSCWSALPTLDSCLEGLDVVTSCLLLLKRAAWTKPKAVCLFVFIISIFKISSIPAASLYWSKQKSLTCSNVTFPTESHTTILVLFQKTVITGTNHLAPSCALSFSLGAFSFLDLALSDLWILCCFLHSGPPEGERMEDMMFHTKRLLTAWLMITKELCLFLIQIICAALAVTV